MNDAPSFPLVWIEWADAQSVDAWSGVDALTQGSRSCVTVGFLVKETEHELYVSGTSGGDEFCCTMIIPQSCVTLRKPMNTPIFEAFNTRAEDLRHG